MQILSGQYTPRQGVQMPGSVGGVSPAVVTMQMGQDINSGLTNLGQMILQGAKMKYEIGENAADRADRMRMFQEEIALRREEAADRAKMTDAQIAQLAETNSIAREGLKNEREGRDADRAARVAADYLNAQVALHSANVQLEASKIPITVAELQNKHHVENMLREFSVQVISTREKEDVESKKADKAAALAPLNSFSNKFSELMSMPLGDRIKKNAESLMHDKGQSQTEAVNNAVKQIFGELEAADPGEGFTKTYSAAHMAIKNKIANETFTMGKMNGGWWAKEDATNTINSAVKNVLDDQINSKRVDPTVLANVDAIANQEARTIAHDERFRARASELVLGDLRKAVLGSDQAEAANQVYAQAKDVATAAGVPISQVMDADEYNKIATDPKYAKEGMIKLQTKIQAMSTGIGKSAVPGGQTGNEPAAFKALDNSFTSVFGTRLPPPQPQINPTAQRVIASGLNPQQVGQPGAGPTTQPTTRPAMGSGTIAPQASSAGPSGIFGGSALAPEVLIGVDPTAGGMLGPRIEGQIPGILMNGLQSIGRGMQQTPQYLPFGM